MVFAIVTEVVVILVARVIMLYAMLELKVLVSRVLKVIACMMCIHIVLHACLLMTKSNAGYSWLYMS